MKEKYYTMMIIKSIYIVAFLLEKNPVNANDKICDMFEQVLLYKIKYIITRTFNS